MNKEQKIRLSRNIAVISGIMAIFVSLLLLINYYQLRTHDPTESKTIEALVERLSDEPNNEALIEEIRSYDLLARKAYFNAQWQVKTGGYLLLFFSIVLVFSLRIYYALTARIESPDEQLENENLRKILARKWVLGAGAVFLILSLLAAVLSNRAYVSYSAEKIAQTAEEAPEDDQIEVIDVREGGESSGADQPQSGGMQDAQQSGKSTGSGTGAGQSAVSPGTSEGGQAQGTAEGTAGGQQVSGGQTGQQPQAVQGQEGTGADNQADGQTGFPAVSEIKNNHNAFRGPFGNGISYHTNIPTTWDGASGENIIWKTPVLKPGYNSPVIWGDRLFISGGDEESRVVYCYHRNTGELLWERAVDNIPGSPSTVPNTTEDTGLAAPTLTTDGRRVYAIFATGNIIAFDMEGNRIWAKNLGVPDNHYGHSSSLISWKEKLFVQYDTNEGGEIITLNVLNGNIEWQRERDARISWASPVLAPVDGSYESGANYQLVLSAAPIVAGYQLDDGEELWQVDCMMGEVGPSPAYSDGYIYAANEYANMVAINTNNDYQIEWDNMEYLPEVSSPVVSEGLLFIVTSYGVLVCYDAKNGEKYWEQEYDHGFYSSPMVAEGKLFVIDMGGVAHIAEVDETFSLVGEPQLGEDVFATPAFMENRIYLRGKNNLYCIGKE